MSNSQMMHTICMRTEDGENIKEGEFKMKLAGANPRLPAVKLALGSLEFPIVQYTIEEDWSRLYFNEGFKIKEETSFLRLEEECESENETKRRSTSISLPLYLNEIEEMKQNDQWIVLRCKYPHNMWVQTRKCIISAYHWGEVHIVCSPLGKISLTQLDKKEGLYYLSETEFMFKIPPSSSEFSSVKSPAAGFVHFPIIPTIGILCDLLTYTITHSNMLATYDFKNNIHTNRVEFMATEYPPYSNNLKLTLHGSQLASMLGYSSSMHHKMFRRSGVQNLLSVASVSDPLFQQNDDKVPLILPSDPCPLWDCIRLTPGWYAPQHRPMTTGNPLRLPQELETAFNRLYFPLPERIPQGMPSSYFLIFTDPMGITHNCPLYAGRYTPVSFCAHLEHEMTRLSRMTSPEVIFSVFYDDDKQTFTIACERKSADSSIVPGFFSLMLNHPAQFDPSRFGFPAQPLSGSDSYTSTEPVVFPHLELPRKVWSEGTCCAHSNIYRVSEIQHQKKLRFHATSIPNLTCRIISYSQTDSTLRLRTYVGQLPFAHGLQPNDMVNISELPDTSLFTFNPETNRWSEESFEGCPMAMDGGRVGIVMSDVTVSESDDVSLLPIELYLRVRYSPALLDCIDRVLQIQPQVRPFSFCFSLPKSIKASMLGFPRKTIEWGQWGCVNGISNLRLPPIDAPFIHNLDHPDYVLVYFEEGKKTSTLQHTSALQNTTPFAKLVLYPLFREERMLPRDTTLMSGESFTTFTIKFTNPDGTPYHFHGAQFSFSLNFVSAS